MLDAKAIIKYVQREEASTTWRVWRGRGYSAGGAIIAGVVISLLILAVLSCTVFIVMNRPRSRGIDYNEASTPMITPFDATEKWHMAMPMAVVFLVIAGTCGFLCYKMTWHKAEKDRDTLHIITPQGVVQARNVSNPELLAYRQMDFSLVKEIQMRGESYSSQYAKSVRFWLDVHMHDGECKQWVLLSSFDAQSEEIIQSILEAFLRYREL